MSVESSSESVSDINEGDIAACRFSSASLISEAVSTEDSTLTATDESNRIFVLFGFAEASAIVNGVSMAKRKRTLLPPSDLPPRLPASAGGLL